MLRDEESCRKGVALRTVIPSVYVMINVSKDDPLLAA